MFWKLFGSYGTLIFTSLGILSLLVSQRTERELLRNVERSLHSQAILFQPTIESFFETSQIGESQQLLEKLGEKAKIRITLIDADGVVLADSSADPHRMENHATRPEILQLKNQSVAMQMRVSGTVHINYMYVALKVTEETGETKGFLRLAVPVEDLQARIREIQMMIWGGTFISGVIALFLGVFLANHFSKRVEQLSLTATKIAEGDYDRPIDVSGNDQIGSLAHALHRMRRQLTEHIADSERVRLELQTILETMPEGVVAIDPDQRILFANPMTHRIFGLPRRDISGHKVWELLRHPGLQEAVTQTHVRDDNYTTEFEILNPHRMIAFRGTPLRMGMRKGILMVLQDITELRRLERLRQDFFANVSHELKTPLAAIKAFTETLLEGGVDDEAVLKHFLSRIDEQADRLHALVVDMLMLARVESKEKAFDIQTVDLGETVEDTTRGFADRVKAKNLELKVELASDALLVLADPEGAIMIFSNLIDNACKYARESGWIRITSQKEKEVVAVSVSDNGIGIPEEDLGRVFERFYRVDKARSRQMGGTGLGLSIVKHLTQTFGGTVCVESRLNEGTTFTVRLPIASETLSQAMIAVKADENSPS